MKFNYKFFSYKKVYMHFCILAFFNIFFSTENIYAKTFTVNDIEISTPFEINFDKNNLGINHSGLIVTLGDKGASYQDKIIPQNNPQQTIDVSGAGDTFVAAFALDYYSCLNVVEAIDYANQMASNVVNKRGVATP